MSKISAPICRTAAASRRRSGANLKRVCGLVILALLVGLRPALADEPDDQYFQIYGLIQQADDLNANGKDALAKSKYQEAQSALNKLRETYPEWNAKLVSFRLNYLAQRLAAQTQPPPGAVGNTTASQAPEARGEAPAAAQASTLQVKLLEAGAEPRKMLRLHPKPGDKQTLSLTMKMVGETEVGGVETPPMKMPGIRMTLDSTVQKVSDNGDITYQIVMGDTSVIEEPGERPEVAEAMKAAFAGGKGLSGTGTVSSRGFGTGVEFKAPAGNPLTRQFMDQMKELFTQLVIPVPEEAVGPGARWEVKMPIKAQGMTIDQTATYQLVSFDGERITIKSVMVQHAANQKVQNPAMPGVKMNLTKMVGNGSAEWTFDLTHVLPIAGTSNDHSETSLTMSMGGQQQAMTTKMDVTLQFEAK